MTNEAVMAENARAVPDSVFANTSEQQSENTEVFRSCGAGIGDGRFSEKQNSADFVPLGNAQTGTHFAVEAECVHGKTAPAAAESESLQK